MRSVIFPMMISLDGYVARPDGALDWVTMDEEIHAFINDQHREIGAYLNGRRSFEMMAAAWPPIEDDPSSPDVLVDYARIWKAKPKVVFSRTLEEAGWNARIVREDVAAEVIKLKREPGSDMLVGGPTLAASFFELGLIDAVDLFLNPVVLGSGVPMFPALEPSIDMQLIESRTFDSGVVYLRYRLADQGDSSVDRNDERF